MLPDYAKRLSRKGVTVKSLYEDYVRQYPDGYKRAQFGTLIRRYRLQTKAIGHVEHLAGDQMYVDFAGDRLQVTDAVTGEITAVEVFAAILLTHLMLTATDMGLANMWIWDFDPRKVREVLPETREHGVYALLAIGHPAAGAGDPTELHSVRKPLEQMVKEL